MPGPLLTFSTGSLYLYGLERVFALAAEYGFDGVEIMCDERLDTRQPDYLCRLSERHGLPIHSLHAPFVGRRVPGWEPGPVRTVEQTVVLAEQVGATHVVMHLPDRVGRAFLDLGPRRMLLPWFPVSAAIKRWMESGGLARLQAGTDVQVCVENLPIKSNHLRRWFPGLNQQGLTWWNTLDTWPQVHDYLTLDTTHWATHGIPPLDALRAANGRVRHIHLSNFQGGEEHQLPQRGELDLTGFLQTLVAEGFDGQIVVEVNPRTLEAVDEAKLRANLAEAAAFCREGLKVDSSQ